MLAACGGGGKAARTGGTRPTTVTTVAPTTTSTTTYPRSAKEYLDRALDTIQNNAYYADRIDWPAERAKAERMAANATEFSQTYPAIEMVLKDLGDNHSRLATPQQVEESSGGVSPQGAPDGRVVAPGITLLRIPVFNGPQESPGAKTYVDGAEGLIRGNATSCGWVIDLRGNSGGNLVPMLLGVGPILGEGDNVRVRDSGDEVQAFAYRDKQLFYGGRVIEGIKGTLTPLKPAPAVALLTDPDSASSAEFVLLAFRGRPDTRSFGTDTVGLTSGNGIFAMPDKAQIVLTISVAEDRQGHRYDGPVPPDQPIAQGTDPLPAAIEWLQGTPECKKGSHG